MSAKPLLYVPILLVALFISPATPDGDAATLSSLSLQRLTGAGWGDFEDAGMLVEVLVNWDLFQDDPNDTWEIEWWFLGVDRGRYEVLFRRRKRIYRFGPRTIAWDGYGNGDRRFNEDPDINPTKPVRDEIRVLARLYRNGVVVDTQLSNLVTGYF